MDHLQTEARNPASTNLDELTPLEIVQLMNREDGLVIPAVAAQAATIARAIEIIAEHLRGGGRLVYAGAGTSGRLGVLDATECPPTFSSLPGQVVGLIAGGTPALTRAVEGAEDHPEMAESDLTTLGFNAQDVLVGIATSGRTPYVLGALAYAHRVGAPTIGLTCNVASELHPLCDLAITPVVGPEILSGSTRLKAGTATKLVLNMLTTGAMVRLGKTFGNLMVDLRATNNKLRARTNRIVRLLAGLSEAQAALLLQACGGELKTALVAQLAGVTPEEARNRLAAGGGQVRRALENGLDRKPAADLCLGIDGGGTRTVALLASAEGVLGRGEAGPSNFQAVGLSAALGALDDAVGRAFVSANRARTEVATACLGLAGAGRPEDQQRIRDWASRSRLAQRVEVTTDADLLLAAGTPEGWGLALVAGTGSIALGRSPSGCSARAGGWGYLMGDEGSGYALAVAGLRVVARAADGRGPATSLTELLLARLAGQRPQDLVRAIYQDGLDRASLADLAPIVLAAADRGDGPAQACVEEGAIQLAEMAAAVASQLNIDHTPVPLALSGGVLVSTATYQDRVLLALRSRGITADPVTLVQEPAEGALRLARQGKP
jgi:N-acetylmuramic acid 6-phosphate etherase